MPSFSPTARVKLGDRRAVLVGRATEMRQLEVAYASVRDRGATAFLTIVGAAGIGKTRLV
jgi:hypothetical protein